MIHNVHDTSAEIDQRMMDIARQAIAMTTWGKTNIIERLGMDREKSVINGVEQSHSLLESGRRTETFSFERLLRSELQQDPEFNENVAERIRKQVADRDLDDPKRKPGWTPEAQAWDMLQKDAMASARTSLAKDGIPPQLQDPDHKIDRSIPLPVARAQDPAKIHDVLKKARHDMQITQADVHGVGEKASVARLLYVHAPFSQMTAEKPGTMRNFELPEGHSLRNQFLDARDNMKTGDFSQAEHDARRAQEIASWMAPMLSQSTRNLLGVGMDLKESVVAGIMKDAKAGMAHLNEIDTRQNTKLAEMGARKSGLAPDAVKRAGMLAATQSMQF